jgi:uncharacterized protein (TIGR03084 family)
MKQETSALRSECERLEAVLKPLATVDWQRPTLFFAWTVADEIMHLHLIDLFGLASMTDPDAFANIVADVRAKQARGIELSAQMRERFGHLPPLELLETWHRTWVDLCARFEADDAKRRIPWFGPSMSVRSFASARQMEVWAHGQDIFDVLRVRRSNDDSIRNICDLGVRTFEWSFKNRREEPPSRPPRVRLRAPSGAEWSWNDGETECVEGAAEDFALVVTQRRNVADTKLRVSGAGANRWMAIAQCFAGAPETGPAPGVRVVEYR